MKGVGRLATLNGYFGNFFNEKEQVITLTLEAALFSLGQRREMMKDCLVQPKQRVVLQKSGTINRLAGSGAFVMDTLPTSKVFILLGFSFLHRLGWMGFDHSLHAGGEVGLWVYFSIQDYSHKPMGRSDTCTTTKPWFVWEDSTLGLLGVSKLKEVSTLSQNQRQDCSGQNVGAEVSVVFLIYCQHLCSNLAAQTKQRGTDLLCIIQLTQEYRCEGGKMNHIAEVLISLCWLFRKAMVTSLTLSIGRGETSPTGGCSDKQYFLSLLLALKLPKQA